MKVMTKGERITMEYNIREELSQAVGNEYAEKILNHEIAWDGSKTIMDEIVEDICVSSEWDETGNYNDDDVRFAIGRSICKRIGTDF